VARLVATLRPVVEQLGSGCLRAVDNCTRAGLRVTVAQPAGVEPMSARTLRNLALLVSVLTTALVATTVTIIVVTGGRAAHQFDHAWAEVVASLVVLGFTAAGLAIVLRRPRNRIGCIVLLPAFTLALEDTAVPAITTTHVILGSPTLATEVFAVVGDALVELRQAVGTTLQPATVSVWLPAGRGRR
jgi:hypothetical protein